MKFDILQNDTIQYVCRTGPRKGKTISLKRIISLEGFTRDDGRIVPEYTIGGYIENPECLSADDDSWISGTAKVIGNSKIQQGSWVDFNAIVEDCVINQSIITDRAFVSQSTIELSIVRNNATILGFCQVHNCTLYKGAAIKNTGIGISEPFTVHNSNLKDISSISGTLTQGASCTPQVDGCLLEGSARIIINKPDGQAIQQFLVGKQVYLNNTITAVQ